MSMDIPLEADPDPGSGSRPVLFYRFRPYSRHSKHSKQIPCREAASPELVARWVRGKGFVGELALFPRRPPSDLQVSGHPAYVVYGLRRPAMVGAFLTHSPVLTRTGLPSERGHSPVSAVHFLEAPL